MLILEGVLYQLGGCCAGMGTNQSIRVYAQLFDHDYIKDVAFYKILYTIPVHPDALLSTLIANSQVILTKNSVTTLKIIQETFYNGLVLLNDATMYPMDENTSYHPQNIDEDDVIIDGDGICSSTNQSQLMQLNKSVSSIVDSIVSVDGDDITDIKSAPTIVPYDDDDDDITTMNEVSSTKSSPANTSDQGKDQKSVKPTRQFEAIDEELRIELVINILIILQILFDNIYESNKVFHKSKPKDQQDRDLLLVIFDDSSILLEFFMKKILMNLKWYLLKIINDIEKSQDSKFITLGIIKESLLLINNILKSLFLSLTYHISSSPQFNFLKKLISYFLAVDFSLIFDKLLKLTSGPNPKIQFSPESLIIVYSIIATLANIPNSLFQTIPKSSDITNINHSKNNYESLQLSMSIDDLYRLIPIYCMELNYFYNYRPDILNNQIKNVSFFSWLTRNNFNDNLYNKFQIVTLQELSESYNHDDNIDEENQFIQELVHILEKKEKRHEDDKNDILEAPELLCVTLLINTCFKNPEFINHFTKQSQEIVHKIEDLNPQDNQIEFFEIWLCISSYIFQYQYKSLYFQYVSKLSLHLLIKSLKQNIDNVKNYKINEFKWKLSHQKAPIVPNDYVKNGIKSSLFYILDVLQNLIRFNLTNKLKIDNYQLAFNCMFMILQEFQKDSDLDISTYNWSEFYKTIFSSFKFIKNQKLVELKYFQNPKEQNTIVSLLEEILQIINFMLLSKFNGKMQVDDGPQDNSTPAIKSINYDLIYNILLNYNLITGTIEQYGLNLPNLQECLQFYAGKIHLTEESKLESSEKIDLIDYDFDSPELTQLIVNYLKDETHSQSQCLDLKLPQTFIYTREVSEINESDMIKIINVMLIPQNKPLSRFFHQSLK